MTGFRHRHLHEIIDRSADEREAVRRSLSLTAVFFSALTAAAVIVGLSSAPMEGRFQTADNSLPVAQP